MRNHRVFLASTAIFATLCAAPAQAELQRADIQAIIEDYLSTHPEAVEPIVKNYLVKNPEVLRDALAELLRKRLPAVAAAGNPQRPDQSDAIKGNAALLFNSAHQAVLGNPRGNVTMVEFFDYNCGYCKRALADTLALLKDDPDLRIVLKEFPVLGPGSLEAARISIAVRMQDPSGAKFLEFHRRVLAGNGSVDKSGAMAIAGQIGLDVKRIERDMSSDEARETLEESARLAQVLGVNGTPVYVVGNVIIPGAIGAAGLKEKIALARSKPRD